MSGSFEFLIADDKTRIAFREIWEAVDAISGSTVVVSPLDIWNLIVNASYSRVDDQWRKTDADKASWAAESNAVGNYLRFLYSIPSVSGSKLISWIEQARFSPSTSSLLLNTNLKFLTETWDIGADGANRPRHVYAGTSVKVNTITLTALTAPNPDELDVAGGMLLHGGLYFPSDATYRIGSRDGGQTMNRALRVHTDGVEFGTTDDGNIGNTIQRLAIGAMQFAVGRARFSGGLTNNYLEFNPTNIWDLGRWDSYMLRTGYFGTSIVVPTVGPVAGQQHVLPAVASDTIALLNAAQTLSAKTLITPTIASFVNAAHGHQDAAGGETLDHGLALTGLTDDDHSQYVLRSILSADGDLFVRVAGAISRLAVGAATKVLGVVAGLPAWRDVVNSFAKSGSAALVGDVTLSEGANVTLTQVAQNIEIAASGGGASPGGGTGAVQFNAAGAFGGDETTFFWDNAAKFLGIGLASPAGELHVRSVTTSQPRGVVSEQFTNDAFGAQFFGRKSRVTAGNPAAVLLDDRLFDTGGEGYDGAGYATGPLLRFMATENWSGAAHGSDIRFFTIGNGTTMPQERMQITADGVVNITGQINPQTVNIPSGYSYFYNSLPALRAQTALDNWYFGGAGNLTGTGDFNTAVGVNALLANTEGVCNTAVGVNALLANTTGVYNTAVGVNALLANTTGGQNTAVGLNALQANTTGSYSTAVGRDALYANTGEYNTAVGWAALYANTAGWQNTAVGGRAGDLLTIGVRNIIIGYDADPPAADTNDYLSIGVNRLIEGYLVDGAIADGATGILIRRNVGGAWSTQQVLMGEVGSGGAGYRLLRVAN